MSASSAQVKTLFVCKLLVGEVIAEAEGASDQPQSTWQDPLQKTAAFDHLQQLMDERIIFIDGAMGTSIQKHRYSKWINIAMQF